MALQGPVCWPNIAKSGRLCQHSDVAMLNYVRFLADVIATDSQCTDPVHWHIFPSGPLHSFKTEQPAGACDAEPACLPHLRAQLDSLDFVRVEHCICRSVARTKAHDNPVAGDINRVACDRLADPARLLPMQKAQPERQLGREESSAHGDAAE